MTRTSRALSLPILIVLALAAYALPAAAATTPAVRFKEVLDGYSLPLLVAHAGGASRVIFIVEQTGKIKRATFRDGRWVKLGAFLDLTDKVIDPTIQFRDEQGLLGLAFHPKYRKNGRFYVNYTRDTGGAGDGDSVIAEYRRTSRGKADPASERIVMVIGEPDWNHNSGQLVFGPDGRLYIGVGDGGGRGDPGDNGQDTSTPLASILRIDPRDPDRAGPRDYAIPVSNPFVGDPGLDEIWAYGLRNPWRFSFDRETGKLWIGDVGERDREEVNKARANRFGRGAGRGKNYGWSRCEGSLGFKPVKGDPCSVGILPIHEYGHAEGWCSVTGGYVHRGPQARHWHGLYVAADWCGGLFVLNQKGQVRLSEVTGRRITSFGEDAAGRIYATGDGRVYLVRFRGSRP